MSTSNKQWLTICHRQALIEESGVCALIADQQQVAIFHLPQTEQQVFAISNFDPIGQANVLYRGITGCVDAEPVVASPLYKQHFSLITGKCLQEQHQVSTFPVRIFQDHVQLMV